MSKGGWPGEGQRHSAAKRGAKTVCPGKMKAQGRPSTAQIKKIKIGDSITFRAVTRWGAPTLTRIVTDIRYDGIIGVRAHSWNPFWVRNDEIIEIMRKQDPLWNM